MIFGPIEIVICLGAFLLVALVAALALAGQNLIIWWKGLGPRCPKCFASVNAEAYICWSCKAELEGSNKFQKSLHSDSSSED